MERIKLEVKGMSCAHCVDAVSAALSELEGVKVESVAIGSATLTFDPEKASIGALVDAVSDAGYEADEALE